LSFVVLKPKALCISLNTQPSENGINGAISLLSFLFAQERIVAETFKF
jgi:hypothetical protein